MKKVETVKVNQNEYACLDSQGNLLVDGAFYDEGMDDYEWFFSVNNKDLPSLFLHTLSKQKIGSSQLTDICKKQEIDYNLNVWR